MKGSTVKKIEKILRSRKAMKVLFVASIALSACFYGMAILLSKYGLPSGIPESFGQAFVVVAVFIYAYLSFTSGDNSKNKKERSGG